MLIPFYQVDAFTDKIFSGNPAAVCVLESWLPDDILQSMTREHNQSETAFLVKNDNGYALRWFTVKGEIDLCGHATLASAHVIFNHLDHKADDINFSTRFVGPLKVARDTSGLMTLDFPVRPRTPTTIPEDAAQIFGVNPTESFIQRDRYFIFESESDIRNIVPDFQKLAPLGRAICVTAPGDQVDFVSRFFCPGDAVPEDPVTGSSHTVLIPYWAERLNKTRFIARQLSHRPGELHCVLANDRVLISGRAKTYMSGIVNL